MHGLKRKTIPKIWKKVKSHTDAGEWKYEDGQEKVTYAQKSLFTSSSMTAMKSFLNLENLYFQVA